MDWYDCSESEWEKNWSNSNQVTQPNKTYNYNTDYPKSNHNTTIKNYENIGNKKIVFNTISWLKLKWFRDKGGTEVSAWAITDEKNPLFVKDLIFIKQENTVAFTKFDDEATGKMVYEMGEQGITPNNCMRIWVHTHPGNSATPSGHDEIQFNACIENNNWFIMLILAKDDSYTCRIGLSTDLGKISYELAVTHLMDIKDLEKLNFPEVITSWEKEYKDNVSIKIYTTGTTYNYSSNTKSYFPSTDYSKHSKLPKMPYQNIRLIDDKDNITTTGKKEEFNILVEFVTDFNIADKDLVFPKMLVYTDRNGIWLKESLSEHIIKINNNIKNIDAVDLLNADYMLLDVYNRIWLGTLDEINIQPEWAEYSSDNKSVFEPDDHINFILTSKKIENGKVVIDDSMAGAI